jgi:hypothetical protein
MLHTTHARPAPDRAPAGCRREDRGLLPRLAWFPFERRSTSSRPLAVFADVVDVETNQLGAPQRPGEAHQNQGPVRTSAKFEPSGATSR